MKIMTPRVMHRCIDFFYCTIRQIDFQNPTQLILQSYSFCTLLIKKYLSLKVLFIATTFQISERVNSNQNPDSSDYNLMTIRKYTDPCLQIRFPDRKRLATLF